MEATTISKIMKTLRTRNAELFIDSLGIDFNEEKKANLTKVLVEFQEFLDKKEAMLEREIDDNN